MNLGHELEFRSDRVVGQQAPPPSPNMQILVVVHGSASLHAQAEFKELAPSGVVVVRPGVRFELRHAHALQLIRCGLDPGEARKRLGASFDERALTMLLSGAPLQQFEVTPERFRSLIALLSVPTGGGEMGNLGRLLILLETIVEAGSPALSRIHNAVLKSIEAFEADVARDWSLPELALVQGLDPSYLARVFKSSVDLPPIAYLAAMRSELAARLLLGTRLSCADVGHRVGWSDANYFSRRFRQHFGESPTAYRSEYVFS